MQSLNFSESLNKVINDFFNRHNLVPRSLSINESFAIYWGHQTIIEVKTNLNLVSHNFDPTKDVLWGILFAMLERIYLHVEAANVAYITESASSSEVISRTIIESSINLLYIFNDHREGERLAQYFANYLSNEQLETEKWIKVALTLPEKRREVNINSANDKVEQLRKLQDFIDFSLIGIDLPTTKSLDKSWPNISERFRLLGLNIDYRTIYATLSSQTHSDAEDLINYFVAASTGKPEKLDALKVKHEKFSHLMLYVAIGYYINAAGKYAERFSLTNALKNINIIGVRIRKFIDEAAKDYVNEYYL